MPPFAIDPDKDTLLDVIGRWAEVQPDAPVFLAAGQDPLSYGALARAIEHMHVALNDYGLGAR